MRVRRVEDEDIASREASENGPVWCRAGGREGWLRSGG